MFTFLIKCPHCNNNERFSVVSIGRYNGKTPISFVNNQSMLRQNVPVPNNPINLYGVGDCPRPECGGPVLFWFHVQNPVVLQDQKLFEMHYAGPQPTILGTWPQSPEPSDSEHWPVDLRENFREVQEDIMKSRSPSRIVSTCRSVLEVALADMGYPKSAGSLQTRIDKARQDGKVTIGMADWAKKIKIDGNEAIHELKADRVDAERLVNFIRTFLEIAFDLPEKIKALGGIDAQP